MIRSQLLHHSLCRPSAVPRQVLSHRSSDSPTSLSCEAGFFGIERIEEFECFFPSLSSSDLNSQPGDVLLPGISGTAEPSAPTGPEEHESLVSLACPAILDSLPLLSLRSVCLTCFHL